MIATAEPPIQTPWSMRLSKPRKAGARNLALAVAVFLNHTNRSGRSSRTSCAHAEERPSYTAIRLADTACRYGTSRRRAFVRVRVIIGRRRWRERSPLSPDGCVGRGTEARPYGRPLRQGSTPTAVDGAYQRDGVPAGWSNRTLRRSVSDGRVRSSRNGYRSPRARHRGQKCASLNGPRLRSDRPHCVHLSCGTVLLASCWTLSRVTV
jgi:hypothetical protein